METKGNTIVSFESGCKVFLTAFIFYWFSKTMLLHTDGRNKNFIDFSVVYNGVGAKESFPCLTSPEVNHQMIRCWSTKFPNICESIVVSMYHNLWLVLERRGVSYCGSMTLLNTPTQPKAPANLLLQSVETIKSRPLIAVRLPLSKFCTQTAKISLMFTLPQEILNVFDVSFFFFKSNCPLISF